MAAALRLSKAISGALRSVVWQIQTSKSLFRAYATVPALPIR